MKLKSLVLFTLMTMLLMACSSSEDSDSVNKGDIKELVQAYTVDELDAESASITSTELIVKEEGKSETIYELPSDEFFVSIAPFINETHPCEVHSLTGCQGELVEEEFDVTIKDSSGETVLDETKKTEKNGFIDLWLPRDDVYDVKITQDEKVTESEISTFEKDQTCITTMHLQ